MAETFFAQADPTGATGYATTAENGSYGIYFTPNSDCTLEAIWFYSPNVGTPSLPTAISLFSTTDGTTNTQLLHDTSPSWSGAAGSGWVRAPVTPTALTSGTHYVAQYYSGALEQAYIYTASISGGPWLFPETSTSGTLTAPVTYGSGPTYNEPYYNGSDVFPTTYVPGAPINWLIDVEVNVDGINITPSAIAAAATIPAPTVIADHGASISPSAIAATATIPAPTITATAPKYNVGQIEGEAGVNKAAGFSFAISSSVNVGDVMIVTLDCFTYTSASPAIATPTSGTGGANTWTPLTSGGMVESGNSGTLENYASAWYRVATSDDPGSTFDVSFSGTVGSTDAFYWAASLDAYSNFNTANPIGTVPTPFVDDGTGAALVSPTGTTTYDKSWVVQLAAAAVNYSGSITAVPSGTTQRGMYNPGDGIDIATADSNGSVGNTGTSIGGGTFTATATAQAVIWTVELRTDSGTGANVTPSVIAATATIPAATVVEPNANVTPSVIAATTTIPTPTGFAYQSTTSGIDTYDVFSPYNNTSDAGVQTMRVLAPDSPSADYNHAFLLMLPVEPGQGSTYGDPLSIAQTLGIHNSYNITCVQPGYPIDPWFADNDTDSTTWQETFTLIVTKWIKANLQTTGTEKVYLIGFSKSGNGGQDLQLRNPDVFEATASWDAPFTAANYDDYDGNVVYGDQTNFADNYELDTGNLTTWKNASNFGSVKRIWIGGYASYQADDEAYDSLLTSVGILHTYDESFTSDSHAWHNDWVAAGVAAIVQKDSAITPGAIAAAATIPSVTVTGSSASISPSAIAAAATIPSVTVTADSSASISPSAIAATATIPSVTITANRSASISPSAITATASIPSISFTSSVEVSPSAVAASSDIPTPEVYVNISVSPSAVAATASIPTPSVSSAGNVSISPGVISATASIPTPTITAVANASITVGAMAAAATIPSPTLAGSVDIKPSAITATATIPTPTVSAVAGASITATAIAAKATIQPFTVSVSVSIHPSAIHAAATIPSASVSTSAVAKPSAIAAKATLHLPTLFNRFGTSSVSSSTGNPITISGKTTATIKITGRS